MTGSRVPGAEPGHRRDLVGGVLVALAAVLFGFVVVWGKQVLAGGMPVESMLALRFGTCALIVAAVLLLLRRPMLAVPEERLGLALLALFGYAVEATLFFTAAQHGTAAAVTLLFFTYPVFVTLGSWAFGLGRPSSFTLLALACALGGAAVVVATGAGLAIETVGVVFALATAVVYSGYLIGTDIVLKRTSPLTSAIWVSGGASLGLLVFSLLTGSWQMPSGPQMWWRILAMGVATAGAFVCLLAGIQRIGAVRTSIVSALEPLAAAVLGYLVLGETVTAGVAVGGALILVGAVMASLGRVATPQEQQIP